MGREVAVVRALLVPGTDSVQTDGQEGFMEGYPPPPLMPPSHT